MYQPCCSLAGWGRVCRPYCRLLPNRWLSSEMRLSFELLILQLRSQGIRHLVMCTGHLADQIEEGFGDGHKWDVAIDYSRNRIRSGQRAR